MANEFNPWLEMSSDHSSYRYPDRYRQFFGEHSNNADPMISGFGFVFFTVLPPKLRSVENAHLLGALVNTITVPDITLNNIEYAGRDGGKWGVPGDVVMGGQTISMNFTELVGIPVHKLLSAWVTLMRNPQYGFMSEIDWKQEQYKGRITYCTCTPDLKVQFAAVYAGIYPTSIKDDAFGYDKTSQQAINIEAVFQFDHYPYKSNEITSSAQQMVDEVRSSLNPVVQGKYDEHTGTL